MARLSLRPAEPLDVLVIDDDPQYVRSMTRLLGVAGCTARGETDALAGVALAESWRPDVALIDYFMPGLKGPEVIARIRAFAPCTPCIIVSGYAGEGEVDLLHDPQVQGMHGKAQPPERLVDAVRLWGRTARILRASGGPPDACRSTLEMVTELSRATPAERVPRALAWLQDALRSVQTAPGSEAQVVGILATFQVVFEALQVVAEAP